VVLTGVNTHFQPNVTTADFGQGITVTSLSVNSFTLATAVINVDPSATTGSHGVVLTTLRESAALGDPHVVNPQQVQHFDVSGPGPVGISSAAPNSVLPGQQGVSVVLTGVNTHFQQNVTTADFGAGITVASLRVTSTNLATAVINVDPSAAPGSRAVVLTTLRESAALGDSHVVNPQQAVHFTVNASQP